MNKVISHNRKARFNYLILDTFEAGIVLFGSEVKSLRAGNVSIGEGYIENINNELFLINVYIGEYKFSKLENLDEKRKRKLLLNKKQIYKIITGINQKGFTAIPLKIYLNDKGLFKLEIGLAKGKTNIDKRQTMKEREAKKEQDKALKTYRFK